LDTFYTIPVRYAKILRKGSAVSIISNDIMEYYYVMCRFSYGVWVENEKDRRPESYTFKRPAFLL